MIIFFFITKKMCNRYRLSHFHKKKGKSLLVLTVDAKNKMSG